MPERTPQGAPRNRGEPSGREKGPASFSSAPPHLVGEWRTIDTPGYGRPRTRNNGASAQQVQTSRDSYLLPRTLLPGQALKTSDTRQAFGSLPLGHSPSPSCLRAFLASSENGDALSRSRAFRKAALASSRFPAWDRASPSP